MRLRLGSVPPSVLIFASLVLAVLLEIESRLSFLSQRPEVQVQMWVLQDVQGGRRGPRGGPEPGWGRTRGGQDVVDAELDLGLRLSIRGRVCWPRPVAVQRADGGGVGFGPLPTAVALQRAGGRLPGIPEADLHVPAAAAAPEVPVLKKVEHRFAAAGEGPVVPLPLFVALRTRNLRGGGREHSELKTPSTRLGDTWRRAAACGGVTLTKQLLRDRLCRMEFCQARWLQR